MEVMLTCPNVDCGKNFIGYYDYNSSSHFTFNGETTIGNLTEKFFSETILNISPNFVLIYNQAYSAEQYNLSEICGVGYRKALEFLIKDYLILNNESESEKIKKKLLGACIADYIDNIRLKSVAKRAVWLGNDETHYIKKWETKDLQDLKKLIELTLHWIEMESLTDSLESEMPE
ncbi:DUF4145 domain-containing protein [Flavobacterium psychrophilum]|nr:DUF4145 domain-containing protein [Flavobacterium psychrophilum]